MSYYSESIKKVSDQNQKTSLLLSTIAHDISGPLIVFNSQIRNISIFTNKLSDTAKTIENISTSVKHLLTSINSEVYTEKLDVNLLIKNIINSYKAICDINNQILIPVIDKPFAEDTLVSNESILIHHIVGNLISNACKFSAVGTKIQVKYSRDEKEHPFIEVQDQGKGISDEKASSIFTPGKAYSEKGVRGESGTGLGLSIVKMFAERLGAEISISTSTDEHNHGTTFRVTLPKNP